MPGEELTPLDEAVRKNFLTAAEALVVQDLGAVGVHIASHVPDDPCPPGTVACRKGPRSDTMLSTVACTADGKPVHSVRLHHHSVGLVA